MINYTDIQQKIRNAKLKCIFLLCLIYTLKFVLDLHIEVFDLHIEVFDLHIEVFDLHIEVFDLHIEVFDLHIEFQDVPYVMDSQEKLNHLPAHEDNTGLHQNIQMEIIRGPGGHYYHPIHKHTKISTWLSDVPKCPHGYRTYENVHMAVRRTEISTWLPDVPKFPHGYRTLPNTHEDSPDIKDDVINDQVCCHCPSSWTQKLSSLPVFVICYGIAGIWMTTLGSLLGSQITSIERHLGLSSSKTGLILSSNDIGYLMAVLFGSHIGKYLHIPRCLSISGLVFGISVIAMSFGRLEEPKVWLREIKNETTDTGSRYLCSVDDMMTYSNEDNLTDGSLPSMRPTGQVTSQALSWAFWLFVVSAMVGGMVKSYRIPLLTHYVESNIKDKSRSGMFIGTSYRVTFYIYVLQSYVLLVRPTELRSIGTSYRVTFYWYVLQSYVLCVCPTELRSIELRSIGMSYRVTFYWYVLQSYVLYLCPTELRSIGTSYRVTFYWYVLQSYVLYLCPTELRSIGTSYRVTFYWYVLQSYVLLVRPTELRSMCMSYRVTFYRYVLQSYVLYVRPTELCSIGTSYRVTFYRYVLQCYVLCVRPTELRSIGSSFTAMVFGPPIALLLGSYISSLPVDLQDTTMSKYDQRWVGAWWLGFVIVGGGSVLFSLPVLFFPKQIRPAPALKNEQNKNVKNVFIDLPKSVVRIFRRPVYILALIGGCIEGMAFSGWFAFSQKYIETQFNRTTQQVSMTTGIIVIFSLAVGTFLGGFLTSRFKLQLRGCAIFTLVICVVSAALDSLYLLFGCDNSQVLGLDESRTLSAQICGCSSDTFFVCGDNNVDYRSPCMAGCTNVSDMVFGNCSEINGGQARPGLCSLNCPFFIPFMVIYCVGMFIGCSGIVPGFLMVVRSVESRDQSLATGASAFCQTLVGFLPSPILFGKLIDTTCRLWSNSGGYCMLYDRLLFRYYFNGIYIGLRTAHVLLMIVLLLIVHRQRNRTKNRIGQGGTEVK
ncbi:Solute carrier organic anion transporter member 1A4 [Bulinus truncatus]|nr:Solute carrier organic anion transporter member 1A4 [Bulinus truncatus]